MGVDRASKVRSVVVVSSEHGELALADLLLRGFPTAGEWRILLPPKLYDTHKPSFVGRAVPYASLREITSAITEHDPQIVLLCSAYLFALDKVLTRGEVKKLLDFLRARACTIATTDPFLGLAGILTYKDVDTRYVLPGEAAWKRALVGVASAIVGSRAKLVSAPRMDDVVHLYPNCAPKIDDGVQRLSFFAAPRPPSAPATQAQDTRAPSPPRWLFVLADIDVHTQLVEMELRDFVENLLGLLRFAVAEGIRPTLIAPSMIVNRLAAAATPDMELHRQLPIAEFRRRSLDAEYVFYWNAFSASQFERLSSELPIFVFDRGYMSRALKPFYETAKAHHFGSWEPKYLDQRQLFSPYVLAHLAKQQRPALRALRERWQTSSSPEDIFRQLLATPSGSRVK